MQPPEVTSANSVRECELKKLDHEHDERMRHMEQEWALRRDAIERFLRVAESAVRYWNCNARLWSKMETQRGLRVRHPLAGVFYGQRDFCHVHSIVILNADAPTTPCSGASSAVDYVS